MSPQTLTERRNASRFRRTPKSEYALILHPAGEELLAEVYDESLGGLGLILGDRTGFERDLEVDIIYGYERLVGSVRHIDPLESGEVLIGFECERK